MKTTKLFLLFVLGATFFATACESGTTTNNSTASNAPTAPASAGALRTPMPPPRQDDELLVIETTMGKFKMAFYPEVAPKHMAQIKKLAKEGFYDGLAFHRVIPNGIIQGGDPQTRNGDRSLWGMGMPGQETVPAEFSSLSFARGTVGMARRGTDNNSATSQFFICLEAHPAWDGQYTIIGEIVQGLNNVQIISNVAAEGDKVREKVVMKKVYLEKRTAPAADAAASAK